MSFLKLLLADKYVQNEEFAGIYLLLLGIGPTIVRKNYNFLV